MDEHEMTTDIEEIMELTDYEDHDRFQPAMTEYEAMMHVVERDLV